MKKIALITGANKGIGLETARQLGKRGVYILLGARDEARGKKAVATLKSEGLEAEWVKIDMTSSEDMVNAKDYIQTTFGRLDILVNNAGMINHEENWGSNSTKTVSIAALQKTFQVNLFGLVELTQTLLPLIEKSEAGRIVNLSSIMASLTFHAKPNSPIYNSKPFAYSASKTALNQFTVHLAHALKDTNIIVTSVHPGWIQTDLGGKHAPTTVAEGAMTSVRAALDEDVESGSYIYMDKVLPW